MSTTGEESVKVDKQTQIDYRFHFASPLNVELASACHSFPELTFVTRVFGQVIKQVGPKVVGRKSP